MLKSMGKKIFTIFAENFGLSNSVKELKLIKLKVDIKYELTASEFFLT